MSKKSVFCVASSEIQTQIIIEQLQMESFPRENISILHPDTGGRRDFSFEKKSKTPEGIVIGAIAGGLIGGGLGWAVDAGIIAIHYTAPFLVMGSMISSLMGTMMGGFVGGVCGGLLGAGIPEFEAKRYAGKLKKRNILIAVHTENPEEIFCAKRVFNQAGAHDICTTGESPLPVRIKRKGLPKAYTSDPMEVRLSPFSAAR